MFDKIKDFRNQVKMIKDLQGKMNNVDMSNPEKMLESMGFNVDDLQSQFETQSAESIINQKVPLSFINESSNIDPQYAYESDSGFDLRSTDEVWVPANGRVLVPTGLKFDIPSGYEIQVRSKSGLALNQGLMVLNSPGTVDQKFSGEIKIILFNTTNERIKIEKGKKVAQGVLCPVVSGKWVDLIKVETIESTERKNNGFGSTGI